MEQRTSPSIAPRSEAPVAQKLPYAPPKATFVPLKLEERLFSSFPPTIPPNCGFTPITPPNCQPS
jgi:hypothetical protein